jgi:hypothetical protein
MAGRASVGTSACACRVETAEAVVAVSKGLPTPG